VIGCTYNNNDSVLCHLRAYRSYGYNATQGYWSETVYRLASRKLVVLSAAPTAVLPNVTPRVEGAGSFLGPGRAGPGRLLPITLLTSMVVIVQLIDAMFYDVTV